MRRSADDTFGGGLKAPGGKTRGTSTAAQPVSVPAGTDVARFAVTSGAAGDDVDLYVYRGDTLVDSSTGRSPDAEVTLMRPEAGDYTVYVNAHAAEDGADATGDLQTWVVPQRVGSHVELSTDAVGFTPGQRFRYTASWSGLEPNKSYLGVVTYGDTDRRTLVEIN